MKPGLVLASAAAAMVVTGLAEARPGDRLRQRFAQRAAALKGLFGV